MKLVKYSLILLLTLSACKSKKVITERSSLKNIPARKIIKNHLSNIFNAETLDSKIKVQYSDTRKGKRKRHSFTVRLRMKRDSVIWFKGSKVVTVFKAKITPNKFSYYSPLEKNYFEGDFSLLEEILGIKVTFSQLQDLLIGQSIFDMKGKRYEAETEKNGYKITPKVQEKLFDVFFRMDPKTFKLNQMYLEKNEFNTSLRVTYERYTEIEGNILPIKTTINATEGEDRYTFISMDYRSLTVNKPVNISYRIPSGYKQIEL